LSGLSEKSLQNRQVTGYTTKLFLREASNETGNYNGFSTTGLFSNKHRNLSGAEEAISNQAAAARHVDTNAKCGDQKFVSDY
jgi:hypothetical protein